VDNAGTPAVPAGSLGGVEWETDVLGEPYQRRTIELGSDSEGPVVATLVSRRAQQPTDRAVLYVHGYNDYFFQTHQADFWIERGYDFYALDLRKYGRSLLPHQTPNYISRIEDYFQELDLAARLIQAEEGHRRLLISAHSTGGLITSLWAHARRAEDVVDGLFLNSPFFEFNLAPLARRTAGPTLSALSRVRPLAKVLMGGGGTYGRSIHSDHYGEWSFDTVWKPIQGFPARFGWVAAIRTAQARLQAGLAITVPILVGASLRSYKGGRWSEEALGADAVLDVEHIARYSSSLGTHVTIVRFEGGLHDLTLSAAPVRKQVFAELERWLHAYLPD
jgi:alpha-beta hydrolase superfamily lysophospholipase